jgi:hypothetical protein
MQRDDSQSILPTGRIDLEENLDLTILSTENLMRNWQVCVVSSAF